MAEINLTAEIKAFSRLSSISRMRGKIQGFAIEDTINNLAFPVYRPVLDTSKPLLHVLMKEFKSRYGNELEVFPYHYVVEMSEDGGYNIHNTRPISQKFPANREWYNLRIKEDGLIVNKETQSFFKSRQDKDIQEMLHILIIGDSNLDVYGRDIYKKLGSYIIAPFARLSMIPTSPNIFLLNMGSKFNRKALVTASTTGA